jgi:uncharacterized protein (DUF58 family)
MKNKALFLGLIITGLFFLGLITRNSDLLLINIFFIIYLFAGIIQSPVREEIKLSAKRRCHKSKDEHSIYGNMTVQIVNGGRKTICVSIEEPYYERMEITEGSLSLHTALPPGEETEFNYTFKSIRGGYEWNHLTVKVSDPFGIFVTNKTIEAPERIFIQPRVKKFRPFQIHPWKTLSSPGSIPTRKSGCGTNFYGIREYHPGDPLRTLDWKKTARYPHQFFTREFEQERNADITLVIDGRKDLDLQNKNESLFEIEIKSAASLAEMFLHQGHRVGLSVIGENFIQVMPGYGKKQLHRILNSLSKATIKNDDGHKTLYKLPIKQFSTKTLIIFLSPFHYNDIVYYRKLRALGFQVVLICPDSIDFLFSETVKDNKDNMALRVSNLERRLNLDLVSQLSIPVIDWQVTEPLLPLIRSALGRPLHIRKM